MFDEYFTKRLVCVMLPSSPAVSDLLQFLLYLPLPGGRILGRNHPGGNSHQRTSAGEFTQINRD